MATQHAFDSRITNSENDVPIEVQANDHAALNAPNYPRNHGHIIYSAAS